MNPATLERALHKWPLWEQTILEGRSKLNFKPAILRVQGETNKWEKEVGWDKAVEVSLASMSKAGLPWYFGFYWMACFCADYHSRHSVDYSRIKVPPQNVSQAWAQRVREQFVKNRGIVMLYHKGGPKGKLYPPYPFLIETSFLFGLDRGEKPRGFQRYGTTKVKKDGKLHEVSGVFEVDRDGYINPGSNGSLTRNVCQIKVPAGMYAQIFFGENRGIPPKFVVEFPMFLATKDVVSMAFKQIQVYREGFRHWIPHFLLKYLGEAKVSLGEDILEERRGAKEDVDRCNKGELNFEELIHREWQRELTREGTVAFRLKHRQVGLSAARTTIYHRVRRRLVRAGIIPPRPKKGWRSALKYTK